MTKSKIKNKEFMQAIKELIELDYAAISTYEIAIKKVENENYKTFFTEFMKDHKRHIIELSELVVIHGGTPPTSLCNINDCFVKDKNVIAKAKEDADVIKGMLAVARKKNTYTAYKEANERNDQWEDSKPIIKKGLKDEKRHMQWLNVDADS
jgi:rubrerythrin